MGFLLNTSCILSRPSLHSRDTAPNYYHHYYDYYYYYYDYYYYYYYYYYYLSLIHI